MLGVTSRCRAAGDSIGGLAFGAILRAGRAAAGSCIASDLADLIMRSDMYKFTLLQCSSTLFNLPCTDHRPVQCAGSWQSSCDYHLLARHCRTICPPPPGQECLHLRNPRLAFYCWGASFVRSFAQTQLYGKFRGQCRPHCRVTVTCAALQLQTPTDIPLFFCTVDRIRVVVVKTVDLCATLALHLLCSGNQMPR